MGKGEKKLKLNKIRITNMDAQMKSAVDRAMALRKNARFALNNALVWVLSNKGLPLEERDKFSVKFDDDNETHEVYLNDKGTGLTIEELDALEDNRLVQMIPKTYTRNDLLLPDVDYKM